MDPNSIQSGRAVCQLATLKGGQVARWQNFARVPSVPLDSGTLASCGLSTDYEASTNPSVPLDLNAPPRSHRHVHRHAQMAGRGRDGGRT
jgi:hypothetical protein